MATCKACGAEITWAKWPSGKSMPVDAQPTEDGDLVIWVAVTVRKWNEKDAEYDRPRYKSHFSTCPNAEQLRRRQDK
jgi:hypothetical protein